MKQKIPFLLILLLLVSCQKSKKTEIEKFNEYLGKGKAEAFDELVYSFEEFIDKNFPNQKTQGERIKTFLEQFLDNPNTRWIYQTEKNKSLLGLYESSNLRKEIELYTNENYKPELFFLFMTQDSVILEKINSSEETENLEDIIEIPPFEGEHDSMLVSSIYEKYHEPPDSFPNFNINGKYITGIAFFKGKETSFYKYIDAKFTSWNMSNDVIAHGFLNTFDTNHFGDPFVKRMIVVEIYIDLIRENTTENNLSR